MSVAAEPGGDSVHGALVELPVLSPDFLICGHLYTLTLLLHEAELAAEQDNQVRR